ncbi:MAG: 50S ribosomal protein L25/general stress protein Ctc [Deltaproteobacteria bacterium]|nr:50S ribosomal protein L25/general stress protein Ctc [Deltaproteobacteria bacterium]MBW2600979.1 50S ribosomal protein L25/general stress protein Ctc [Deltaproteobacteria bacterium]
MDIFDLKATQRKETGKGHARTLRRQGLIPAVLYGPKTESIPLTISSRDLRDIYKESGSEHMVLNLTIENGGTRKKTVMIKELQTLPATSQYLHVDFYEISLDQAIVVKVPVKVVGTAEGVERGGIMQMVRHELEISCLPTEVPARIEVDISKLDIGDSVHIDEIEVGEKVTLLYDTNFTVVTIVAPTVEEEPEEELLEEGEEIEGEEAEGEEAEGEEAKKAKDKPAET